MRKTTALRTCIGILFLLLLAGAALYAVDAPFFNENSATGSLHSMFPNMTGEQGTFSSPEAGLGLKMLVLPVKLTHRAHYTVSFTVREVIAAKPVLLKVDLVGVGYDSNEQEFQMPLPPGTRDQVVREILYSGKAAPAEASLRIFFDDPAQVTISNVEIIGERRTVRRDFKRALGAGFLLLLGLLWYYRRQLPDRRPLSGEQRVQAAVSVIFLILLAIPMVQKELKVFDYTPLNENRRKLEKPGGKLLFKIYTEGTEYSKAYEKYFNDHYGLRDIFIQLKNQMDFNIFKRSDSVIIGRDGWMEYKDVAAVQEIRAERMTPEDWQIVRRHTEQFQAYLQAKGIILLWLPIHMKFSIYPEYLPYRMISRPQRTAFDRLIGQFDANPAFEYIDARKLLLAGKKKHQVFYKTDFHWNEIGAFIVAKEVVNRLGCLSGRQIQWTHPLDYEKKPGFDGGINRYLAVFYPPLENKIELKPTWEKRGSFLAPEPPFSLHYRAQARAGETLLPKTLVIGDSYSHYYFENNGFYEYFQEVYLLHSDHLPDLPRYLPEDVRYVVFQFIEVAVGGSFCNPDYWPQGVLPDTPAKARQAAGAGSGR